jgi:hypothetical protein
MPIEFVGPVGLSMRDLGAEHDDTGRFLRAALAT